MRAEECLFFPRCVLAPLFFLFHATSCTEHRPLFPLVIDDRVRPNDSLPSSSTPFRLPLFAPLLPHSKNGWKVNHCQCQSRHYQCSAVRRRRRGVQRVFWVWLVKGGKWPGLAVCRGKRKRRESASLWAPLSAAAAANQPSTNHPPVAVGHRTHCPPPPLPPLVSASLPLLVRRASSCTNSFLPPLAMIPSAPLPLPHAVTTEGISLSSSSSSFCGPVVFGRTPPPILASGGGKKLYVLPPAEKRDGGEEEGTWTVL